METFTKVEIASIQLQRALVLFCAKDYISALTLAGAAEEILGKIVEAKGEANALTEDVCYIETRLRGKADSMTSKQIASFLNQPRNQLKHFGDVSASLVSLNPSADAESLIERATLNYLRACGKWPDFDDAYERYNNARNEQN
ncbi:MAG: hypothetical protein RLZZ129_1597 [Verrucomicrobiota bacterium]|jgi:hypothetical protein